MFSAKYVNAPFMHDNGTGSLNASGTLVPTTGSSTVTVAVLDPEIAPKPELDTTALSLQDAHRVDGGLEAWSVIAGASVALFVQFGLGGSSILLCTVGKTKFLL
jgi:hypothetical protein